MCGTLLFGAPQTAAADDGITIGMAVAFSGWMEAYDGEAAKMAQLWIEQTNAKGGVLGKQIKVITADTKTDRVEGAKAGKDLIDQGANLLLVSADYDYGAPAAHGNLARRVEIDRHVVVRDRMDLRYANRFNEGREVRDLRAAQDRLACDRRELRAARGYRPYAGRW